MKTMCPNCQNTEKFYKLKDGRLKCSLCKKYFTPQKKTLHIKKNILDKVITLLLENKSTDEILNNVSISKFQLLKIKKLMREEVSKKIEPSLKLKTGIKFSNNINTFEKCCCLLNKQNKKFLNYLEKSISGKGGIRDDKIKDILTEYFWRFENKKKTISEQKKEILTFIKDKIWFI